MLNFFSTETSFGLDKQTAHPCLVITGKNIVHPSNACPSVSDWFTDNCYSVFGNDIFSSGAHYWEVIIHGQGSKVICERFLLNCSSLQIVYAFERHHHDHVLLTSMSFTVTDKLTLCR